MNDWNTAERERENPTAEQCWRRGQTHVSYGWARSPNGDWDERQTEAYNRGFSGKPLDKLES